MSATAAAAPATSMPPASAMVATFWRDENRISPISFDMVRSG
jgi:hypothetical protein